MTPQELEQWVLAASDMSLDQQKRWEATNLLNTWVAQHDSDGVVVRSFLDLVAVTRNETVLFYALTTLQRLSLSPAERSELRNLFFLHHQNYSQASTFLKTKMAVVLALLVKKDYPTVWPQALEDVLTKLNTEMSLRSMLALLDDLVSHGDDDSTRVKDAMRGYNGSNRGNVQGASTPTASLMEWLVGMLTGALQQLIAASTNSNSEATTCASLGFQVLKRLVGWVDISLVLEDTVLNLVFGGLEIEESTISLAAAESLRELVGRGMPEERKIEMLVHINLFQRIHNSKLNIETVDVSPIEVVIEIAKLINMIGLELLPLWEGQECQDPSSTPLNTLLQQLLELFFQCFAYDDIDVSGAVIALASRLTTTIDKEKGTLSNNANNEQVFFVTRRLPQLLAIMFRQMRYPADFEFDFENEEEAEEEVYRADLRKFNQNVVRICPDVCLQFLCEALASLPVPISSCPTPDLEVALRLVYHYCEGIRPPPGMKRVMKNETFCAVLVALHQSDITSHAHREVLLLYYDICVRYHPVFNNHPELLPNVLESISGARGLQHSNARVRSRSCYMLLRIVKSIAPVLRPYVETAVSGILQLLSNPNTYPLRPDDTLYLFETIGLLLGKTGLEPAEQQRHLTEVMTPHVNSITTELNNPDLSRDPDYYGTLLSGSIAAIAFLSKGFSQPPPEVQAVLVETVSINLGVLEALPGNKEVRNKTFVLLQRMIQCIGNRVLSSIPRFLHLLIEHCTSDDILDVAQLLNQLCLKFKEESVPAIDAAMLPFLRKCHSLMPATGDVVADSTGNVPPHLLVEQLSIKKLTFAFLQYVVTYNATGVLTTATNVSALESVLQTMNEGASVVEDPGMKRTCITFFRELVDQWGEARASSSVGGESFLVVQQGFFKFVFETFVPGMIKCMLSPGFNEKDAMQARNVSEMGNVLFSLRTKRSDEFERHFLSVTLGQVGCPVNVVNGFRTASNAKEMKVCLNEMMKCLKLQNAPLDK